MQLLSRPESLEIELCRVESSPLRYGLAFQQHILLPVAGRRGANQSAINLAGMTLKNLGQLGVQWDLAFLAPFRGEAVIRFRGHPDRT